MACGAPQAIFASPPAGRLNRGLMTRSKFANFSWGILLYSFVVIVWGAFVRASFSGDGCGNQWPLCGDAYVPNFGESKTIVEFIHRVSTFLLIPLLIGQFIWAYKIFRKRDPVRWSVAISLLFIVIEALIGAVLVKKGYVGWDKSVNRAMVMSSHLASTFILLASVTLTSLWSSGIKAPKLKGQGSVGWAIGVAFAGVVLLGISGAMSALGDMLNPSSSLMQAFRDDFSPTAHFLVRLRPLHPLIAVSVGVYLILIAGMVAHFRPSPLVRKYSQWLGLSFIFQIALGVLNLALQAPIWMQLVHLLSADIVWVILVATAAAAFDHEVQHVEVVEKPVSDVVEGPRTLKTVLKEYLALTKPRVISLLLFTTLTAMFAAKGGWPGGWLLLAVSIGGYMSAGAANTINMVIDRDIDGTMKRTAKRPTVTQNISSGHALTFGFTLAATSFVLLWLGANLLTAMLSLAGLAFYVVIYTLILKRRTWQNIVIGGAAGAFPPLVGWASVTDQISPLAWLLFAIIFVWTPVHFWALALMIKDDYANAGVPMLPVVRGVRATVVQIVFYGVLTTVISIMPILQPHVGWSYLAITILLNLVLMLRCMQLYVHMDRPRAVSLYKYSMLYLAILFLTLALDRAWSM